MRMRVALGAVGLALVLAVVFATCSKREEQRSTAVAYVTPSVAGDVSVEADVTLPRVPSNRGWYGVWLMVLGSGDQQHQPFVQGGLMRRKADPARAVPEQDLAPFVAYRLRDRSLTYLAMPAFAPPVRSRHHVAVGRHAGVMFVSMDGVVIHTEKTTDVLDHGEAPTFQLAAELFAYGDRAAGTIENVRIRTAAERASRPATPRRFFADRGTCLVPAGTGYAARGVFATGAGSGFIDTPPRSSQSCPFDR